MQQKNIQQIKRTKR